MARKQRADCSATEVIEGDENTYDTKDKEEIE